MLHYAQAILLNFYPCHSSLQLGHLSSHDTVARSKHVHPEQFPMNRRNIYHAAHLYDHLMERSKKENRREEGEGWVLPVDPCTQRLQFQQSQTQQNQIPLKHSCPS